MSNGSASQLGPGTILDGKYEILNLLGAGGMGEVFKARHVHLNTFRCIKVMKQGLLADDGYRSRFLREARLATQIHHPNIAVVHDFFIGDGGSYMVSEYIDGTTVRQWGTLFGVLPLPLAADVATQVLSGLDHIHRRGLLHRDISADNVMLSYDSDDRLIAKIIDLGVAKDVSTGSSDATQSGMLIGNPKYMSPEQLGDIRDGDQLDGRTDLYSLGIVLYEMLIGISPFASETPHGYIIKHLTERPPRFAERKPEHGFPPDLEPVIFRALEKKRDRRYPDARALAAALQPFLAGPPGLLTRKDISSLRRGDAVTVATPLPVRGDALTVAERKTEDTVTGRDWKRTIAQDTIEGYREYLTRHPDSGESTEAKARLFELELLDTVHAKEEAHDRDALQRLSEAHPRGSAVGDAARDALARVKSAGDREREEELAFQRAASWRAFIDVYPSSVRMTRARRLLDEAVAFEAAAGGESETQLREFLKAFPDGRHRYEAEIRLVTVKQRLADAAFARAVEADTYAAMRDYIAKFPASTHANHAANAAKERLAWESAAAADSEEAWDEYLARFPDDRHTADARTRRDRAKAGDEEAFRIAADDRSAAAWKQYLAHCPDGKRKARAELHLREALAFESARDRGRDALDEFVRQYSGAPLAKDARRILRQLADEEDYAQALSIEAPAAWRLYLTAHPGGEHADRARQRLVALEDEAYATLTTSKHPEDMEEFLADFPESPRADEVRRMLAKRGESAAIAKALDAATRGDVAEADAQLAKIIDADRRAEVETAIDAARDKAEWNAALQQSTVMSFGAYLAARPEGRWAGDARRRLARLEEAARESESGDFDSAWERGTAAAWDEYLAQHADSVRAADAVTCRQEARDFELAGVTNTRAMWRAFLATWPEGRHALDAKIRLRAFG
jgi:serine/threonine protein kinase/outer membrane protein assembly factor BamD (BamD/ComL family)